MRRRRQSTRKRARRAPRQPRLSVPSPMPMLTPTLRSWLRADPLILSIANAASTFTTDTFAITGTGDLSAKATTMIELYSSYRFLKIRVTMYPLTVYGGMSIFTFSDDNSPVAATFATSGNVKMIQNSNTTPPRTLTWTNTSPANLSFIPTSSTFLPVTFIAYTSNSLFGTPTSTGTSNIFRADIEILAEYRNLGI